MIQGICFDLDGVLIHTDELHYLAWKGLADRLGVPFSREQGDRCRGVSRMQSLEIVLEHAGRAYSQEEKERFAQEKNEAYRAMLEALSPADVPEDVPRTLEELRRRGCRLALASGSKNAGLILARTGLGTYLDAAADGNHITRSKPDPEIFLTAAQMLGLPPERCAAVDDAVAGIQAGRAAGMVTVAIGDSAAHRAGDYDLERFGQLLDLFPGPGEEEGL